MINPLRRTAIAVLVAAFAIAPVALAQDRPQPEIRSGAYVLDPAHSKVTWSVSHFGFSTYVGQFPDVEGVLTLDSRNPAASALTATVKTGRVGTLNAALDTHLKSADFLDTARHPSARFKSTRIRQIDADTAQIDGRLTLRGVTKPVTIEADFNKADVNPLDKTYTLGFDGKAKIRRSDFGVNYGLPAVGDEVTLHLEAEFKLKPAGN